VGCNCGKLKNIVEGHAKKFIAKAANMPDSKLVAARLEACTQCEHLTAMSMLDYMKYIKFGRLPIQRTGKHRFCSLCKCSINAKVRVVGEKCKDNRW
jgi:hypothetical protein